MASDDTGEDLADRVVERLIAQLNDPDIYVFAAHNEEDAKKVAQNLLALGVVYLNTEWEGRTPAWPRIKAQGQMWFAVIAFARDMSGPGMARKAASTLLARARGILVPQQGWCPPVHTNNNPVMLRSERPEMEEGDRATRVLECSVAVRYEN